MTDVDASDQVTAAADGEQPAAGHEVTAPHLAANQRLYEEALACIDDVYRSWRNPASEPVEFAAPTSTDRGAEPADEEASAPDCTEKILLRSLKQLAA